MITKDEIRTTLSDIDKKEVEDYYKCEMILEYEDVKEFLRHTKVRGLRSS